MEIRAHTNTSGGVDKTVTVPPVPSDIVRTDAAPTQTVIAVKQPSAAPKDDEVAHALKSINQVLQDRSQDLEFSVDHDSARAIVKVVDKNTHEVIRQMPTQEALDIAKALDRLQSLLAKQQA